MNETGKTVSFVAAAVVAVAVGVWSHIGPAESDVTSEQIVGKKLFDEFRPEAAKSLEIIEYDADKLVLKPFKIDQENGIWRIPSHDNYPADASQQLGEAAAALLAAEKVNLASDDPTTHVTYGVVDPDPKSLTAGTTGVGTRVTMEDSSGKKLAQVIVGKGIKDKPDLHYVRYPGKDQVYVAKLKTDKFSTKFEDWIEKDLLKLNAWDIEKVAFNDYSIDALRGTLTPRAKIHVAYDSKDAKWKLDELEVWRDGEYEPESLADDEELNTQKLNDLKNALDELKIVDVRRKPEGLAADLRAGEELADNNEAKTSLAQRGFFVASTDGGEVGIYSNEGEVRCGNKDGVEYTLRFGSITAGGGEESKGEESPPEGGEGEAESGADKKGSGANRFIMVTAQFNEELLTKPELTPLPGEKPAAEGDSKEETKDEAAKTSAIDATLADAAGLLALADDEAADQPTKPAEDEKAAADKPAGQDKKGAKADAGKSEKGKAELAKPKSPEQLEQERITKENERKQKEYDDKVKKGKEKAKELSDRFANWYYVVSDSTYHKIHLGRDEIVKKKTPPAEEKKAGETDEHKHDDEKSEDVLGDDLKKLPE